MRWIKFILGNLVKWVFGVLFRIIYVMVIK